MEFNVNEITKLRIRSSAFNLRLIEKNNIENIVCKLKNIDKELVKISQLENTLIVSMTEKGSMIRTIWNSNSERSIRIYVPKKKVFKSVKISAGVGTTYLKNIKTEKLNISCGVGSCRLLNVTSSKKTKFSSGVGKVQGKACTFNNTKLSGGVGLIQISGKLTGKTLVSGGIGKIDLVLKAKKDDYSIHASNSFFENIFVDGVSVKGYKSEKTDAKNSLRLSGGVGSIFVNFRDRKNNCQNDKESKECKKEKKCKDANEKIKNDACCEEEACC
ncbi:MAG: DUF4097 family beta strand repeat-containing protein [Treponemataceae bacterium]